MGRLSVFFVSIWILALVGHAQPVSKPPEFEVASVRPGQPGTGGAAILCEAGRLTVPNFTLRTLIQMAWHVPDLQIIGGPGWMDTEGFYISAKGDASATDD